MAVIRELLGRAQVTGDIGEALNKRALELQSEVQQHAGASASLRTFATKKLPTLVTAIELAKDDGTLEKMLASPEWSALPPHIQLARYAKQVLGQVSVQVLNWAGAEKNSEVASAGRLKGVEECLDLVAKHHTSNVARIQQLQAAAEEIAHAATVPPPPVEPPPSRRGGKTAERRRQAAVDRLATPTAKKQNGASESK